MIHMVSHVPLNKVNSERRFMQFHANTYSAAKPAQE
jgi:hypothetical protein